MIRIAAVVSHPIQYHAPFFAYLSRDKEIDLTVYYSWDFGVKPTADPEFKTAVLWDIPVLQGYKYEFPKNISPRPTSSTPWGEINPGIIPAILFGRFDAVMVYSWNFWTSWFAFLACVLSGTPFFIRGENPLGQEKDKAIWKIRIKKVVLGSLFRLSAGCLYIGVENRAFYRFYGVPEKKLFFMPYAADNERWEGAARELLPHKAKLKSELGLKPDSFVVLTAGKLIPKKRPLDLLAAYALADIENKALVYAGEGGLRSEVERRTAEGGIPNVLITGFRNQLELPRAYAAADVFILPSGAGETWGLVVNEAMCFGLPIVVSDAVGCGPDLVKDGDNGFIFKTGDTAGLAKLLEELARDRQRRESLGRRSLEIVRGYDFAAGLKGLHAALRSLSS